MNKELQKETKKLGYETGKSEQGYYLAEIFESEATYAPTIYKNLKDLKQAIDEIKMIKNLMSFDDYIKKWK